LRCEYGTNPLGIDIINPRLSWRMQTERAGARQSAYRVLVASDL
jgi:alpha-L-rhamnosidase